MGTAFLRQLQQEFKGYNGQKPVVSGSGMAGYGSANLIKTEKRFGHVYLCGDGTSDVADGLGLMAPRVAVCSAHEGTMVLRLLIGETEP